MFVGHYMGGVMYGVTHLIMVPYGHPVSSGKGSICSEMLLKML